MFFLGVATLCICDIPGRSASNEISTTEGSLGCSSGSLPTAVISIRKEGTRDDGPHRREAVVRPGLVLMALPRKMIIATHVERVRVYADVLARDALSKNYCHDDLALCSAAGAPLSLLAVISLTYITSSPFVMAN